MNAQQTDTGTIRFTLFRIPVTIRPSIWIILALLGGAFQINDGSDLLQVAVFIIMGILSLLVHELGHALSGRHFTGCTPVITLAMMGGVTELPHLPRTRTQHFLYVLAGPLASLLLGLLAAILMGLQIGSPLAGICFYLYSPFGAIEIMPANAFYHLAAAIESGALPLPVLNVYATLMLISMWWSLFNLLPILPMDGGQLLMTATNNVRLTATIGMLVGGVLTILSILNGMWFAMMLLGYFAYMNWQIRQESR